MKVTLGNPSPSLARSTPALGETFLRRDRRNAFDRLIGHERNAGVEEIEARARLRLLARLGVFDRRLDALGGHQQRILLGGRADDAGGDVLHAGTTPIDGDDERARLLARGLERGISAGRRRLVDRIDDIDVRILLEQRLHCGAAAWFRAQAPLMADDALVSLVPVLLPVRVLDAETLREAEVAHSVHGGLIRERVDISDAGVLRLVAERLRGPLADQLSGLFVVGREGRVGGAWRIERRVERDHQNSSLARPLDRRKHTLGVVWRDQDRLGANVHQALDGVHLARVVAIRLAGEAAKIDPKLLRFRFRAFLHFHEEWIGALLGDQPDDDLILREGGSRGERPHGECAGGDRLPTRAALVTKVGPHTFLLVTLRLYCPLRERRRASSGYVLDRALANANLIPPELLIPREFRGTDRPSESWIELCDGAK